MDTQIVEYVHDGAGRLRRVVEHQGPAGASTSVTTELFYRQHTLTSICQTL